MTGEGGGKERKVSLSKALIEDVEIYTCSWLHLALRSTCKTNSPNLEKLYWTLSSYTNWESEGRRGQDSYLYHLLSHRVMSKAATMQLVAPTDQLHPEAICFCLVAESQYAPVPTGFLWGGKLRSMRAPAAVSRQGGAISSPQSWAPSMDPSSQLSLWLQTLLAWLRILNVPSLQSCCCCCCLFITDKERRVA